MILPSTNIHLQVGHHDGRYIVVWSKDNGPGSVGTQNTAVFDDETGFRVWLANLATHVRKP